MPTLRAAAAADYPKTFNGHAIQSEEGVNLLPVFNGAALPERSIFFEHQEGCGGRGGQENFIKLTGSQFFEIAQVVFYGHVIFMCHGNE